MKTEQVIKGWKDNPSKPLRYVCMYHKNNLLYSYIYCNSYLYQLKTLSCTIPEIMLLLFSSWIWVYFTLHHVTIDGGCIFKYTPYMLGFNYNYMYHFAWANQRKKQGYIWNITLKTGMHLKCISGKLCTWLVDKLLIQRYCYSSPQCIVTVTCLVSYTKCYLNIVGKCKHSTPWL